MATAAMIIYTQQLCQDYKNILAIQRGLRMLFLKLLNFRNPNLSNPESYTQFSLLLTLVDTFQQLGFIQDLHPTINMNIALTKLPNPVTLDWNRYVLEKTITQPSLNTLANWLLNYAKGLPRVTRKLQPPIF